MLVDGRKIAEGILRNVKQTVEGRSFTPKLGVLTCAPGIETRQYLDLKKRKAEEVGINVVVLELPETASTEDCIASVNRLVADCHGVLVQLPLPKSIDREKVLDAIPVIKDPDGFAYGRDERAVLPPVAGAIAEIASLHNVDFTDKKIVVVGDGRLVGQPSASYARTLTEKVTVLGEGAENYKEHLKDADILITGVGQPHFITSGMVKDGVVIFDAGASEDGGEVVGDVHRDVAQKASLFTPVPGGIGPITVAVLFQNLIKLLPDS